MLYTKTFPKTNFIAGSNSFSYSIKSNARTATPPLKLFTLSILSGAIGFEYTLSKGNDVTYNQNIFSGIRPLLFYDYQQ